MKVKHTRHDGDSCTTLLDTLADHDREAVVEVLAKGLAVE